MTEAADLAADDGADDGPIVLPPGACCGTCAYVATQQVPGPSVIAGQPGTPVTAYFCRRFPPSAVLIYSEKGGTMVGQPPPVDPKAVCFEFDVAPLTLG